MVAAKSTWLALLFLVAAVAAARPPGSFGAFRRNTAAASPVQLRGGAIGLGSDAESGCDDDEYESEYDDDEEDPIVTASKKLSTSAKAAVRKQKTAAIKSKVKVAMAMAVAGTANPPKVAKKMSGASV